MTVTITISEDALEVLEDLVANTFDDASVRRHYNGRGMFSAEVCLGVVVNGVDELVRFVLGVQTTARYLEHDGDQDEDSGDQRVCRELLTFLDALENGGTRTRQDGMGTQVIYYWPRVQVVA